MNSHLVSPSADAAHLYLDFLKRALTGMLVPARYKPAPTALLEAWPGVFKAWLRDHDLSLVSNARFDPKNRTEGRDRPAEAETMSGLDRLNNLQLCIETVLLEDVPGDLLEAGVWGGGASIFARAVLKAYGVSNRTVWLADSFQGVPEPEAGHYEKDRGDILWAASELAASLESVQENFRRYDLLDRQVAFLPGWFRDTLPAAPIGQLAVLRLDGNLYESTMIALRSMYPKLASGGYAIIDDYGELERCRAAVDDFRAEFDISERIIPFGPTGVYWRVERPLSPVKDIVKTAPGAMPPERSASFEHEPALHTLLLIYESRADLRAAFPEAAGWDLRRLIDWACRAARGDHRDGAEDALRPFLDWFTAHSVDLGERMTNPEFQPAVRTLLLLYESRPDLRAAFPEAGGQDFKRLIEWACRVAREETADPSAVTLRPFLTRFERLIHDGDMQYSGAGIVTTAGLVCEAYHDWYYSQEIWKTTKFLNVLAYKSVTDLWNYQEILTELKPSLILELGTYCGGSALYFAETLKLVSPHFRVLTVDIDHSVVAERVRQHDCIELLESDTTNPNVATRFKELRQTYPGKAFCIVDSDHHREHVIAELMLLRDVTEPGDYVVVEDGNINGHPVLPDWGPGPYEALQEYLERYPDDYISDVVHEKKFGFTFAPKGFLIRRDSHTEPPPGPTTFAWNRRLEAQREQRTDTERVLSQAISQAAHYKNLLEEQRQQTKHAENRLTEAVSQAAHYKNLLDEQRQLRAEAEDRLQGHHDSK